MARLAFPPQRRGRRGPRFVSPVLFPFRRIGVLLTLYLCLFTICFDLFTRVEAGVASRACTTVRHYSWLVCFFVSCCSTTAILDPKLLTVLGIRVDWPNPQLELKLLELEHLGGVAASVRNVPEQKARIQEALRRLRAGRSLDDLPGDEIKLFPPEFPDDGIGPIERLLGYTPVSSASLYQRPVPDAPPVKPEVDDGRPRYKLNMRIEEIRDEPEGEPQSHLDDEPQPWKLQKEEKIREREPVADRPTAVDEYRAVAPELFEDDEESDSEDETDTAPAAAEVEEEGDTSEDDVFDKGDEGFASESATIDTPVAGPAPDNEEQSLKWRDFTQTSSKQKSISSSSSDGRLAASDASPAVQQREVHEQVQTHMTPGEGAVASKSAREVPFRTEESEEEEVLLEAEEHEENNSTAEKQARENEPSLIEEEKHSAAAEDEARQASPASVKRDMSPEEVASGVSLLKKEDKHVASTQQERRGTASKTQTVADLDHDRVATDAAAFMKDGNAVFAPLLEKKSPRDSTSVGDSSADAHKRALTVAKDAPAAAAKDAAAAAAKAATAGAGGRDATTGQNTARGSNTADAGATRERKDNNNTISQEIMRTAASVSSSDNLMGTRQTLPEQLVTTQAPTAASTAGTSTAAVRRPAAPAAAPEYPGSQSGAAAEVEPHAAGIRVKTVDMLPDRRILEKLITVDSLAQPAATLAASRLVTVGLSPTQLRINPLAAGAPSFIGVAAAAPPAPGTVAAGAMAAALTAAAHIAAGAGPRVLAAVNRVNAAAAGDGEENSEQCRETGKRERLHAVFGDISEARTEVAKNENVSKAATAAATKEEDVDAQSGAAEKESPAETAWSTTSHEERDEEEGDNPLAIQREAAAPAPQKKFTAQQQEGKTGNALEEATITQTTGEADAKTVKEAGALFKGTGGVASERGSVEGARGGAETSAGNAAATATLPETTKRPLRVEAGLTGGWEKSAGRQKSSAQPKKPSYDSLSWPRVQNQQQRQQQYVASSRRAAEAARQEPNRESKTPSHPAPADAARAYQEAPITNNLPNDSPHRPFVRPQHPQQQQTQKSRLSPTIPQQPQPTTSDIPQHPPLSTQQQQIGEEKKQQSPTSVPRYPAPQQLHARPQQQLQQERTSYAEGVRSNSGVEPTEFTHGALSDELSPTAPHVSEEQRRRQQQQQQTQTHEQEQQHPVDQPLVYSHDTDAPQSNQRSAGRADEEAEAVFSDTDSADTALWREIERRADKYDRARGVPVNQSPATAADCMTGDNERCLEAILRRHCDSWCTAQALKKWDGKEPVWMSLYLNPIPTYWTCVKEGFRILYERHRPSVERLLLHTLDALKRLRTQVEGQIHRLGDLAATHSHEFKQQHPDLWLAAAWVVSVLLLCRLFTGRFFFLLRLLLSATAYVFGCRRRAPGFPGDSPHTFDRTAVAMAQALLADKQMKWLFTQTKKTSFLCEKIRGKLADGTLTSVPAPSPAPAATPLPAITSLAPTAGGGGSPGGVSAGSGLGISAYGETRRDAGPEAATIQQQHQHIVGLLQQMAHQQQQTTQVLYGVQQRLESVEVRQRLYEKKLQEAAAGYSAMFETNSLQQVDTNYAVLKLTMQVLQKLDRELTAEIAEPLEAAFFAHMNTVNEAVAAIKARQLRALFGRRGVQTGDETQEEAPAASAAGGGPPPPLRVAAAAAAVQDSATASTLAGTLPPAQAAVRLTASASLSVTSTPAAAVAAGSPPPSAPAAAAGSAPPPAAEAGAVSLVPPPAGALVVDHRRQQQERPLGIVSPPAVLGDAEINLPWLLRQLWHIQRSLPELLLQHGEFHAQLVLTRKVGDTHQQIVLTPQDAVLNRSNSLRRALGPISAAVNQLLAGSARTGSSMSVDSGGGANGVSLSRSDSAIRDVEIRHSAPPPPQSVTESTRTALPGGTVALVAEQDQELRSSDCTGREAGTSANEAGAEGMAPPFPREQTAGGAATPAAGELAMKNDKGTSGFSPAKQQAARRSAAALFGEPAAPVPPPAQETRHRRSSLGQCFCPETSVLSCPRPPEDAADIKALNSAEVTDSSLLVTPSTTALPPLLSCSSSAGREGGPLRFSTPLLPSAAAARAPAMTPHFPPADASSSNPAANASATAPLLPSPSQSTPHSPRATGPVACSASLLSSPFGVAPTAAGPPSPLPGGFLPSLQNGSVGPTSVIPLHPSSANGTSSGIPPPPPVAPTAATPLGPSSSSPPRSSSGEMPPAAPLPPLSTAAHSATATVSTPPFVPGQAESGNPPLLTALTGVAAAPGLLPSPPSSRSFAAAAAASAAAASSPFPHNPEAAAAAAGAPPLIPTPSPASISRFFDPSAAATSAKGSRRGSRDELVLSSGVQTSSPAPPPPPAFPQRHPVAVPEGGDSGTARGSISSPTTGDTTTPPPQVPPLHTGATGGTTRPPPAGTNPPPPPPPPAPPGAGEAETFFPSPPPPPPPPMQLTNGRGAGATRAATPEAADPGEKGSTPATPVAPSTAQSGLCPPPPTFRGSGLPHPPPSSGAIPPTGRATAYHRPTRFPRERREMPKIQAATNPFCFAAPRSSAAAAVQQRSAEGDGGRAASTHDPA